MDDQQDKHLDEFAFAEQLEGTGDPRDADARAEHLARCAECRSALAELELITRDPVVRSELDRPEWRTRSPTTAPNSRRVARVLLGSLAAAAVLLLGVQAVASRHGASEEGTILRHATIAAAAAPRLIAPAGNVARVDTLTWTSVPRADRYRVTVFDASGAVAWEAEVGDTNVAVPADIAAKWTGELRWRVKARTGFDRWVDSEFGEFSIPMKPK